jgi:hypothetical protein
VRAPRAASQSDSVRIDRRVVPTLTDLLDGQDASLAVYRTTGLVGHGGILRLRGVRSAFLSNAPAVEIDGLLLPVESARMFANGSSLSFLDLLDPNDVVRIEVVPDPARAAEAGPGLANGLIRITTRQGDARGIRFRSVSDVGMSADPVDYAPSYFGLGPIRTSSCSYASSVLGHCTQSSVVVRQPTRDPATSILRTGRRANQWVGLSGSTGRLTFATSGHLGVSAGDFGLPPGERSYAERQLGADGVPGKLTDPSRLGEWSLRGSGTLRLRPNLSAAVTAGAAREDVRLPFEQGNSNPFQLESYLLASGYPGDSLPWDGIRPATAWQSNLDQRLHRESVQAGIRWNPTGRFAAWAKGGLGWTGSRDLTEIPAATAPSPGLPVGSGEHDTTTYRDSNRSADLGARWEAPALGSLRVSATAALQYRQRLLRLAQHTAVGGNTSSSETTVHGSTLGEYLAPTIEIGRRASVTGYLRHDDVRPGVLGRPGLISFGGFGRWSFTSGRSRGWAITASAATIKRRIGIDEAPLGAFELLPVGTPLPADQPETLHHLELGLEGELGSSTAVRVSLYQQRTVHGIGSTGMIGPFGFFPLVTNVEAEIRNRGVELDVRSRALATRGATLDLALEASVSSTKLERSNGLGVGRPSAEGYYPIGCTEVGAAPFGNCQLPMTYQDQNGNGLIDPGETHVASQIGTPGSKYPTRTAVGFAELTLARLGGWISLGLQADYAGGMTVEDGAWDLQCLLLEECRAAVEPAGTPLVDQARIATGLGAAEVTSYLRIRELSLAYRTSGGIARWLGARELGLTLAGRNLWTITGYRGWDPELQTVPGDGFAGALTPPAIRRTVTARITLVW